LLYKILILFTLLRFAVPAMAIASGLVEETFINKEMHQHISTLQQVDSATKELATLKEVEGQESATSPEVLQKENGMVGYIKHRAKKVMSSVKDVASQMNLKKRVSQKIEALKVKLSDSIQSTMTLISLFLIQSILLPLFFLYAISLGAKGLNRLVSTT
jgi:hypothetical protein